jgi:hypothetical protein
MSQANVEIVERAIAASVSEPPDADALAALMHPDHVLTTVDSRDRRLLE